MMTIPKDDRASTRCAMPNFAEHTGRDSIGVRGLRCRSGGRDTQCHCKNCDRRWNRGDADDSCLIWVNLHWSGILSSWWVVDGLERIRIPIERMHFLVFPDGVFDPSKRSYQQEKHPLTRSIQESWLRCWEDFCGNDPRRLLDGLNDRQPSIPELTDVFLEGYRKRFPRLSERHDRVCLSDYDRTILSSFYPSEWRLIPTVLPVDYVNVTTLLRVREWAEDGYGAALESRENPKAVNPYMDYFYRLTPCGESLLAKGIPTGMSAPVDPCGGLSFYDLENLWVLDADNRVVRL